MLDLIFAVLMIVIIVKANKGEVNDTLCGVALVIGVLAGIAGLVQAFFIQGESNLWILNIVVMVFAFVLKRVAEHFAKLYNNKKEEIEAEYRAARERFSNFNGDGSVDNDDPNARFSGGFDDEPYEPYK